MARASGDGAEQAPRSELVITIDGPAGSGKSTTAREVAHRLGYRHLDSGALYRAITFSVLESGIPVEAWSDLTDAQLNAIPIELKAAADGFAIFLGGRHIDQELRSARVTENVSRLAPLAPVRGRLLALQREAVELGGLVADGRDMGSVVFPDADLKIFLVADLEERARRRLLEQQEAGEAPTVGAGAGARVAGKGGAGEGEIDDGAEDAALREESLRLHRRDTRDASRALAPLRKPDDAVLLDTTNLGFEEQVQAVIDRAQDRIDRNRQRGQRPLDTL